MIGTLVIFTYLAGLGLVMSVVWSVRPRVHLTMTTLAAGVPLGAIAERDGEATRALHFLSGFGTSQMVGLNLFALLVLWIPFRHGEAWAWFVLWYYPAMFAWHYVHYAKRNKLSYIQLVYGVLSTAALVLSGGRFL